ncbi:AraC family transcriptional regulator [Ralstonia sp. UBA689]|uniref:AraC family transcriptional regulator n=1 Tax=Ralstonia sp. UBA689 TaxID=1947373 RepID=UPI0025EC8D6D|nr:AraC family transcriptional regulator [Ralstonia sp. UBA689]
MPLISRAHVRLSRLRFPFAVRVQAEQGTACMRDANGRREVRPGDPFVVPAFAHFGCDVPGTMWQPCAITFTAVPDDGCPRMAAIQHDKPWARALAGLVFEHPAQAWNAALLSELWQACPRQVRARLFAEGEALHALVREQRAAWALYRLAALDADAAAQTETMQTLARRAGLRTVRALNTTCASLFGVELNVLTAANTEAVRAAEHTSPPAWAHWHLPLALSA